jgi:hypothetical protein
VDICLFGLPVWVACLGCLPGSPVWLFAFAFLEGCKKPEQRRYKGK